MSVQIKVFVVGARHTWFPHVQTHILYTLAVGRPSLATENPNWAQIMWDVVTEHPDTK